MNVEQACSLSDKLSCRGICYMQFVRSLDKRLQTKSSRSKYAREVGAGWMSRATGTSLWYIVNFVFQKVASAKLTELPAWTCHRTIVLLAFRCFTKSIPPSTSSNFSYIAPFRNQDDSKATWDEGRGKQSSEISALHHCQYLSLIHIWRCRRSTLCRSRWSPYH